MSFWSKIFSPSSFSRVAGIVRGVMPIVKLIATVTPTKSDDQIIQIADALGVDQILDSAADRGERVKEVAVKAAQKKFPDVPPEVLSRAVEAAYQQMKAEHAMNAH